MQAKALPEGAQAPIYLGIDVCKARLDAHLHPVGKKLSVPNDKAGLRKLKNELAKHGVVTIALEATGKLHRLAWRSLHESGLPVAVLNPRRARLFAEAIGALAKTDRIDARVLALAAERLTPEPAAPSSAEMEALQELVHARQAAMAERTAFFEPALDVTSTPSERIDEAHDFGATLPGSDFSHSDAGLDVDRLAVGDAARPRLGVVASFGGVRRLARRHGGESEV